MHYPCSRTAVSEELLATVAQQVGNKFFRLGLMLAVQPHELDRIQVSYLPRDQISRNQLELWFSIRSVPIDNQPLA